MGPVTAPTTGIGLAPISPYVGPLVRAGDREGGAGERVPTTSAAMDQTRRLVRVRPPDDGGEARHDGGPPRIRRCRREQCASSDAKCTTAPLASLFHKVCASDNPAMPAVSPRRNGTARVGRRPRVCEHHRWEQEAHCSHDPGSQVAVAGLALVAVTVVGVARRRGRQHRTRPRHVEHLDLALRLGQPPSGRRLLAAAGARTPGSGDPVPSPIIRQGRQNAAIRSLPGPGPRRRAGGLDRHQGDVLPQARRPWRIHLPTRTARR